MTPPDSHPFFDEKETTRLAASPETLKEQFKQLETTSDVAAMLGVTHARLVWHIWRRPQALRYKRFKVKKRGGGFREIAAPSRGLKILQHKMKQVLDAVHEPRNSVHGFVRGKSVRSNADEHVGRAWVLNLDIQDFFPTITFPRIRGMLMAWPYKMQREAATAVAAVCFAGSEGLPQGAPTSPVLANMLASYMDKEFTALAHKYRCTYTRYSDDITFSPPRPRSLPAALAVSKGGAVTLGRAVEDILTKHGFTANPDKVRLRTAHERQEVTGLVVNERVNVPRTFVREVRAMLHACEQHGIDEAEREFHEKYDNKHRPSGEPVSFIDVLNGKLNYLAMVRGRSDDLLIRLVRRARKIDPRLTRIVVPSDAVLVLDRDEDAVMADGNVAQGSAFLVEGLGLVTASHVICDEEHNPLSAMFALRWNAPTGRIPIRLVLNVPKYDIAVLEANTKSLRGFKVGNSSTVTVGDKLTIYGYPHWFPGNEPTQTEATVTVITTDADQPRIAIDAAIHKGNSGGVAVNARGEAVGVAVTGDSSPKARYPNALVPIEVVVQEMRKHREALAAADATRAPETPPETA